MPCSLLRKARSPFSSTGTRAVISCDWKHPGFIHPGDHRAAGSWHQTPLSSRAELTFLLRLVELFLFLLVLQTGLINCGWFHFEGFNYVSWVAHTKCHVNDRFLNGSWLRINWWIYLTRSCRKSSRASSAPVVSFVGGEQMDYSASFDCLMRLTQQDRWPCNAEILHFLNLYGDLGEIHPQWLEKKDVWFFTCNLIQDFTAIYKVFHALSPKTWRWTFFPRDGSGLPRPGSDGPAPAVDFRPILVPMQWTWEEMRVSVYHLLAGYLCLLCTAAEVSAWSFLQPDLRHYHLVWRK